MEHLAQCTGKDLDVRLCENLQSLGEDRQILHQSKGVFLSPPKTFMLSQK